VEEPATEEAPAVEEASAVEETAVAWRSRPRRAVVGGGVEELGEALTAEEAAAWRSQPCRAAVGPGLLAGGLHRAEEGGCRRWMMG
jgi:hypothetical protein